VNPSLRNKELANFLKTRRLRLTPQAVGLVQQSTRRRIKGLRREEVAALSGVSVTWYTYLEQGRQIKVSEQVLESIARTLQLDNDEKNYLFTLAASWLAKEENLSKEQGISSSLQMMLDDLQICPAYIVGNHWEVIAWNRMACAVFGDFSKMNQLGRNLIWRMFTDQTYRNLFIDWESMAKRLLAQFRTYYAKNIDDPWYMEIIENLKATSLEFKHWWEEHEVIGIPEGKKGVLHPRAGLLSLEYNTFLLAEHQDILLNVYTPDQKTDTKEKLIKLRREWKNQ